MHHLYLSPHLDDAIWSCGGRMHAQRRGGEPVTVLTLCAGAEYTDLAPLARECHAAWQAGPDPVAVRREEDRAVLQALGVVGRHLDTPDAIYRRVGGVPAYPNSATLFAAPHPHELERLPHQWAQAVAALRLDQSATIVYAPLAAGGHVDHQLARALGVLLAAAGWQLWFYEDFPHSEAPDVLRRALDEFRGATPEFRITAIDVEARLTAMRGYRTQVAFVFGTDAGMASRTRRYTADVASEAFAMERLRRVLAGAGGRRERLWRGLFGYHVHAERVWRVPGPC